MLFLAGLFVFGALYALARATRNDDIVLSAIVLGCVWAVWAGFIYATKIYEPWQLGIALDALAALVLLVPHQATRPRIFLASLYWTQIAVHTSYGWVKTVKGIEPHDLYGDVIDGIAILQILFVGGWAIADLLRGRGVHPLDRRQEDRHSMAKSGAAK